MPWLLFWDGCGHLSSPGLSRENLEALGSGARTRAKGKKNHTDYSWPQLQSPDQGLEAKPWLRGAPFPSHPSPQEGGATSSLPLFRGLPYLPYLLRPARIHAFRSCKPITTPPQNRSGGLGKNPRGEKRKRLSSRPTRPARPVAPPFLALGLCPCRADRWTPPSVTHVEAGAGGGLELWADDRPVSHRERCSLSLPIMSSCLCQGCAGRRSQRANASPELCSPRPSPQSPTWPACRRHLVQKA